MNSAAHPLLKAEYAEGEVTPAEFSADGITQNDDGFTIQMPSQSPVPTPTIYRGRLYVGGGFSSQEFYCFDAKTGDFIWGAYLSDDGPTVAVPFGDDIFFNSESCTIFALNAATGEKRWAYYMGDPMMGAPAVADGRVFTIYPATDDSAGENAADPFGTAESANDDIQDQPPAEQANEKHPRLIPTYQLACLSAKTGEVLWRRWLDGDCISAPVVSGGELFIATLPGTLYRWNAADGGLISARHARATTAPLVAQSRIVFTCHTDDLQKGEPPSEALAAVNLSDEAPALLVLNRSAPYLDREIQAASSATFKANQVEGANGIGGGFGGGFFQIPPDASPADTPNEQPALPTATDSPHESRIAEPDAVKSTNGTDTVPPDALSKQQQMAADNVGLGNVSTLQGYHGSRAIHAEGRICNCMGDEVLCTAADSGKLLWSIKLEGDMNAVGGHLAAPPIIAEGKLFIAAQIGKVLQADPQTGKIQTTYNIGSELRYSPAVADGRLYVSTQDGKVVCRTIANHAPPKAAGDK